MDVREAGESGGVLAGADREDHHRPLTDLTAALDARTGGRRLGEMTGAEIAEAFADGPIVFRDGKVQVP